MLSTHRVPLAWQNLTHDRRRLFVALAGIAFAVLLMFVELGFWNALLDSMVELIGKLNADLVIISKDKFTVAVEEPFTRRRLQQAEAVEGVKAAYPLYIETRYSLWKNPETVGRDQPGLWPIRVLAFDPAQPVMAIPEVARYEAQLQLPDTVLLDVKSKKHFGRRAADIERELAQHSIRVVGTFRLGTDFNSDGNVLMSDRTFAKLFPDPSAETALTNVEIGVIQLADGADAATVKQDILAALPADVTVLTKEEFIQQEKQFWRSSSPIGFIFSLGLVMGFAVGMIICYQVLSSDVTDHLVEFATLKAIGHDNRYLVRVVLQEALYLAGLAFVPGLLFSLIVYAFLEESTGLPIRLTLLRGALVMVLTVGMCLGSGMIAVRKVEYADPAEVFR